MLPRHSAGKYRACQISRVHFVLCFPLLMERWLLYSLSPIAKPEIPARFARKILPSLHNPGIPLGSPNVNADFSHALAQNQCHPVHSCWLASICWIQHHSFSYFMRALGLTAIVVCPLFYCFVPLRSSLLRSQQFPVLLLQSSRHFAMNGIC